MEGNDYPVQYDMVFHDGYALGKIVEDELPEKLRGIKESEIVMVYPIIDVVRAYDNMYNDLIKNCDGNYTYLDVAMMFGDVVPYDRIKKEFIEL